MSVAQVDATNHPGLYEFQFANARFDVANATRLVITVSGASGLLDTAYEIDLLGGNLIPPANAAQINGIAATSVTTINAIVGTTVNPTFDGNNCLKADMQDIAGSAVNASAAQLGVNVVGWDGGGVALTGGRPSVSADLINGVSASSVTTVNAVVGTAQPINFTGTGGSALVQTDVTDWKASAAPAMTGDAYARLGAPAGASVSADVAAVKSDTGTTLSDTATILADVNTGAGAIYSRIGAPAGASIAADIASVKTDTGTTIPGKLPAALTGGGNIKADVLAVGGNTSTPATLTAMGYSFVQGSIASGTPTTGGFIGNSGLSSTNGDYAMAFLVFTSGVNQGIGRAITTYTGSTKAFAFTGSSSSSDAPFPAAPSVADTFIIIGRAANGT